MFVVQKEYYVFQSTMYIPTDPVKCLSVWTDLTNLESIMKWFWRDRYKRVHIYVFQDANFYFRMSKRRNLFTRRRASSSQLGSFFLFSCNYARDYFCCFSWFLPAFFCFFEFSTNRWATAVANISCCWSDWQTRLYPAEELRLPSLVLTRTSRSTRSFSTKMLMLTTLDDRCRMKIFINVLSSRRELCL